MAEDLTIAVCGGLTVAHGGTSVPLPASRKTRALLAFLLLSGRAHRREALCEMFWDLPDDPRGALRWSLSKLRGVLGDSPARLHADREQVVLDTETIDIDYDRAAMLAGGGRGNDRAAALVALRQPLLAGIDLPNAGDFQAWLTGQRDAAARLRATLLAQHCADDSLDPAARLPWAREWRDAVPLDTGAADCLGRTLRNLGRGDEADEVDRRIARDRQAAGLSQRDGAPLHAGPPVASTLLQRQKIGFCHAPDGVRLAYACVGNGRPMVKAANWLNHLELDWDAPIWAPLFRELARDHSFVRYDERGNGLSPALPDAIGFDAFVDDLEAVADAAAPGRFPLLGLSQGCAVAVEYAARHPDRVSHLILWGGYAAGWRVDGDAALRSEREAIITLVRHGWGRADAAYRQLFSNDFLPGATAGEMDWFNGFQRATVDAANAARFLEVFADIDVRHRLSDVRAPTLVMHARGDRRVPIARSAELAAGIAGAEFVALDSDNHLLLGREPASAAFVGHIRQFLASSG